MARHDEGQGGSPEDGGRAGGNACDPVVILGGFFSTRRDYWEMQPALEKLTGQKVAVVRTTRLDWFLSLRPAGWTRILKKLDRTVRSTLEKSGADKVVLVGHSTGGVMGRLYLSPEPFRGRSFAGHQVVRALVTLGSPHRNDGGRDGGSAMRRWVNETNPGARFTPAVRYVSVAGNSLLGDRNGTSRERAAYRSYKLLCGRGDVWGDGVVPLCAAHLDGAAAVDLDGVFHSPKRGRPWYGNTNVVRQWWEAGRECLSESSA
jgi:pimeloyl-ACP methyl ester carboxylesterase